MRNMMRKGMLGVALVAGLLTATVAANAAPEGFRGRAEARPAARFDRGYGRGSERPVVREYGRSYVGYGYGYAAPVVTAYIPPCPGDGYVWLNGAWVFRGFGVARGYGYGRDFRYDRGREMGRERGFERGRR